MKIFDCTLRDGGNVFGKGFNRELTEMMLRGLIDSGIEEIEYGHCTGIGSTLPDKSNAAPLSDIEYLELAKPFVDKAKIGMFVGWKNATKVNVKLAKEYSMDFLRVGINATDGKEGIVGIEEVKNEGLNCKVALMKAYVSSPKELAKEAKEYERAGLDHAIIMDSAGMMTPKIVKEYVTELKNSLTIPVGFHGHNNLGLASANALSALEAGADTIDGGLLGMARSAGNISTEVLMAILDQSNENPYNLYSLLDFLDNELIPEMQKAGHYHYNSPFDIILGMSGCHSSNVGLFTKIAKEEGVKLYPLIVEVSKVDQKSPSEELMREKAQTIKGA